ncbi:MAG: ATP-binding protein [Burkholderiales bacterium]
MIAFQNLAISRKLTRLSMSVSLLVLLIACGSFVAYELLTFRGRAADQLDAHAAVVAINATPAIEFNDRAAARETLASLRAMRDVVAAAIYLADGTSFATYVRGFRDDAAPPQRFQSSGKWPRVENGRLAVARTIESDGGPIATVYIESDLTMIAARLRSYAAITIAILAVSLFAARLVSRSIEKRISEPIRHLARTADAIAADKNYGLRTGVTSSDELGKLAGAFDKMLDEIEAQNEDIRRREQSFHELADAMPQMVWTLLADGSTGYVNRQLVEYTGMAANDVKAWSWGVGLHPEDLETCLRAWTAALRTGMPYNAECRIRRAADGVYRWHLARAVPMRDPKGQVLQWFATCTDIDAQKQAENEARQLNALLEKRVEERTEQLVAANKELEAFSYSVSHDLRAPLRAVDGFSRILQEDYDDKLDDEGRRVLNVIRNSSQEMGRLIDDLLAFSRLGRSEVSGADIDMSALVRSILDEMRRENGTLPEVELRALPPAHGDSALLRQVWINLLSNAVKFSAKADHPRIEVGGHPEGSAHVYYVKDNGAGFDMKYYDKLFGVFQRLHRSDEFPGTGVGLAIVQRVVSKHDGKVWAQGAVGQGATFLFTLPK